MTDKELKEAVEFFKEHYQKKATSRSKFETFICGAFRTYPRNARFIMEEMENVGLICVSRQNVTIL